MRWKVALLDSRFEVFKNLMVNQACLGAGLTNENLAVVQKITSQDFVLFLDFDFLALYVVLCIIESRSMLMSLSSSCAEDFSFEKLKSILNVATDLKFDLIRVVVIKPITDLMSHTHILPVRII